MDIEIEIRNKLPVLAKRFKFVPVDKANNNMLVVCRKYNKNENNEE